MECRCQCTAALLPFALWLINSYATLKGLLTHIQRDTSLLTARCPNGVTCCLNIIACIDTLEMNLAAWSCVLSRGADRPQQNIYYKCLLCYIFYEGINYILHFFFQTLKKDVGIYGFLHGKKPDFDGQSLCPEIHSTVRFWAVKNWVKDIAETSKFIQCKCVFSCL